ncbi:hypothetical protein B0T24DRAFT_583183 [Lasiosphaeria ovina]|uniref:RING-type E3 ubiquitin transferase n=1 Tax=Lasiosphaeria ovina TaxID=92902 RepID=A0AAE0JXY5_9PEZI|nr:hypothetical protein B0T24DRAFT_583183 [Lasiosphaeria ovina]
MRLGWYVGASAALAGAVIVSAFHQRANFYSSMVHLAQSSISLMSIVNLVFVVYGAFMYGLQRLFFGPLRPVEIEQLYEKAWFAVTETCLAMTIFREEVGAFFLVMFTALVTGKVWGWIGEGRVEVLEQQPPANPRLFHTRLSVSLLLSIAYDLWLLGYAVNTVVQQARPTMMVMFLFEFAVLTVCSFQTGLRYIVSLVEQRVVKIQTRQRLEDRRRQVRDERAAILRRRETGTALDTDPEELPSEDDVDEMDIEVPGWEAKGQWVLTLDLIADFVKLGIYTAFFCVLFTFYGLPIHIIRDWFVTTRSFLKRLSALIRYRQALKDMDQYPDATAEELGREDTCIICREEMRPWNPADASQVERTRAKKLPCGHILHFGCLKSWLERQQVCPTCRRPVARDTDQPARNGDAMVFRLGLNFPAGQNRQPQPPANGQPAGGQAAQGGAPNNQENNQNPAVRMFNLGPIRLGFAQGGVNDIQDMAQRLGMPANAPNPPTTTPVGTTQQPNSNQPPSLEQIRAQLLDVAQRVQMDRQTLNNTAHEVQTLQFVLNELGRLQQMQQQSQAHQQLMQQAAALGVGPGLGALPHPQQQQQQQMPQHPFMFPMQQFPHPFAPRPTQPVTRHGGAHYGNAIPSGSPDLPDGLVIPPGWSVLPLQRLDGGAPPIDSPPPNPQASSYPIRDILQSSTPQLQNSPQPTPATNPTAEVPGTAQTDRPVASSDPPESSRGLEPQGPPISDSGVPPVTSPTPLAPNWRGQAQLFGGQAQEGIFGFQRANTPGTQDDRGERSDGPVGVTGTGSESRQGSIPESGDSSASNKGKAKAATVQDDDDED